MKALLANLVLVVSLAHPAAAFEGAVGPTLGAASNFGQSWQRRALDGGEALGITTFRDEVIWNHVEQADGSLAFGSMREAYPEILSTRDLSMILLGYSGHPSWEQGRMPRTPEGQAAFARYHAEIVRRFPAIHSVEIGNEFNSFEFAESEDWPDDLAARARVYVQLLATTRRILHELDPEIRILGGAAHSVPLAWIDAVVAAGGAKHMDAFVLHPYTTEPEQLARQVALMRAIPELAGMAIEVTEFGTTDAADAPHNLMRMYSQMAISGVTTAIWYPFSPRGDGHVPLVTEDGTPTDVGVTYAVIRDHLETLPASDVAPDPFTYAVRFGERALVIWGAPRQVDLTGGLSALTATGEPAEKPLRLSRTEPLLILSDAAPVVLGETVTLGTQRMRADSFDQFAYPPAKADFGYSVFVRLGDETRPLQLRPGQERGGVPWTPYLGITEDGEVKVSAAWASPSSWGPDRPLSVVYSYRSPDAERVDLTMEVIPDSGSDDGVEVTLLRNGEVLERLAVSQPRVLSALRLDLAEGDILEAVLGPNTNAEGDHARVRFRVEAPE